jgi:ATP-binding cassette subfamily F protein 3
MITLSDIYIQYGDRILYNNVQIVIKEGEKIGLIGRNGSGKSTLLKMLAGELSPDAGQISIPRGIQIGYLSQMNRLNPDHTVRHAASEAFEKILAMRDQMDQLEKEIASPHLVGEEMLRVSGALADAHEAYAIAGGDQVEVEVEKVLKGLGFKQEELDRKISTFSGGWKMRIELAKLLLTQPNYLLLDEPTNHLDIESIIWLEQYLERYPYSVIVVSHDQRFLDNVTKRTIELVNGKTYDYRFPYSKFMRHREEERKLQEASFKNQQKVIEQKEKLIDKFRAKSSKAKFAKSLEKQLGRIERVELDHQDNQKMRIRFPEAPRSPQVLFECIGVEKKFDQNEVFSDFNFKIHRGERIAFVGQNGQGKSTLAKILVGDEQVTAGALNRKDQIFQGYYAQDQAERLDSKDTLLSAIEKFATAEQRPKLRSILGSFLFSGEDVEKKVSVLSGGERSRLALACMILKPMNFLVLDEPTHHLDIQSKNILKSALLEYKGTLLVVSHDREFLDGLTNKVLEFRDGKIYTHLGDLTSFLEKRNVTEMHELEMKTKENLLASEQSIASKLDYRARKELQRKVQYAERDIEKMEKRIEQIEKEMHDEQFYQKENVDKIMQEYAETKNKLKDRMEEWEKFVAELEG